MSRWALAAVVALAAVAVATGRSELPIADAPYTTEWPGVELSSSIILVSMFEMTPQNLNGQTVVPCHNAIDRAREHNMKSIQFAFTGFWKGAQPTELSGWCIKNGYLQCEDVTAESISALQAGMESCISYAVEQGFTAVAVLPKIDYADASYWRNPLWFNPLEKLDGYSYVDFLLKPLAAALNKVAAGAPAGTTFYLSMQAETARSVVYGTRNWLQALPLVRAALTDGLGTKAGAMRLGISQNNRRVCDCVDTHMVDDKYGVARYMEAYANEFHRSIKADDLRFDTQALRHLYSQVDFVGISGYVMVYPGYTTKDMEMSCRQHSVALDLLGVNLQQLVADGKEIIIFETGLGGGDMYGGAETNVTAAAAASYQGVWGQYNANADPWANAGMRAYRQNFYQQYLTYLSRGSGPLFRVSKSFTFSAGSFDVMAIRWESTTKDGSFRDDNIAAAIAAHNAAVNKKR